MWEERKEDRSGRRKTEVGKGKAEVEEGGQKAGEKNRRRWKAEEGR